MAVRERSWRERVVTWAEDRLAQTILAGRRKHEPHRDSVAYARLMNLGGSQLDKRPLIKPTPANLRMFGKTVFARRAIQHIKDPIANLKWEVAPKAGISLNSELKRQIEIATSCLSQPNYDDSFRSFVEQITEDLLINGAGTYEQQLGGDECRPLWLWPVDSLSIQINSRWSGKDSEARYFQSLGYGNVGGTRGIPLRNDELVYIKLDPCTEHPFGLGPLEVAFAAINRKMGVSEYAGNLASNAQPENLLVFEGMSNEQAETTRMYWRNDVEGQGQTPILGAPGGAKITVAKLRGTDDDALFLKYQEMLIREIATAFGISPMTLGIEKDVNRNTSEVTDDRDWDTTIVPKATLISAYITRQSIERHLGFSQLEHKFLGLKREDKEAEAKIYEMEFRSNAVIPDEYRERNGLPPMGNQWGKMTFADMQIAISAAKGAAEVDDPNLTNGAPTKKGAQKPKRKG